MRASPAVPPACSSNKHRPCPAASPARQRNRPSPSSPVPIMTRRASWRRCAAAATCWEASAASPRSAENILLKPNILIGAAPQKNITTHPAVLKAMGLLLQETGARVRFGDSPGCGSGQSAAASCRAGRSGRRDRHGAGRPDHPGPGRLQRGLDRQAAGPGPGGPRGGRAGQPGQDEDPRLHAHHRCRQEPVRLRAGHAQGGIPRQDAARRAFRRHAGRHQPLPAAPPVRPGRHRGHGGQRPGLGNAAAHGRPAALRRSRGAGRGLLQADPLAGGVRPDHEARRGKRPGHLGRRHDHGPGRRCRPVRLPRLQGRPPAGRHSRPLLPLLPEKMAHAPALSSRPRSACAAGYAPRCARSSPRPSRRRRRAARIHRPSTITSAASAAIAVRRCARTAPSPSAGPC